MKTISLVALLSLLLKLSSFGQVEYKSKVLSEIELEDKSYDIIIDKNHVSSKDVNEIQKNLKKYDKIKHGNLLILKTEFADPIVQEYLINLDKNKGIDVLDMSSDYRSLFHSSVEIASLDNNQKANLEKLKYRIGKKFSIVKLSPQSLALYTVNKGFDQKDGFTKPSSFVMPLKNDSLVVVENGKTRKEGSKTIFSGKLLGDSGDVFFVIDGNEFSGMIKTDKKVYTLFPLGGRDHAIVEDTGTFPMEEPKRSNTNDKNKDMGWDGNNNLNRLEDNENEEIKLLVLYTSNVAVKYPNVESNLIIPSIEQTNQSLIDSKIGNLKFSLAASYQVQYTESGNWDDYLKILINKSDGIIDEIHSLRNMNNADVVVLLVETNTYCGEAQSIGVRDESDAFIIVNERCSFGNFSFAHELGHLFGCRHDFCVDSENAPYPYGHGFVNKTNWRCIMSYGDCCNKCRRIGIWSNPDLKKDGVFAGSKEKENNVEAIRQHAKKIAKLK